MATVLLAPGTAAATSSDFTIPAGSSVFVYLTDADGAELGYGATFIFEVKDGSLYYPIKTITSGDAEAGVLMNAPTSASLTLRVRRLQTTAGASIGASYV